MEDSDDSSMDIVHSSLSIAKNLGVDAPHIQVQKASFFGVGDDDDDDDYSGFIKQKGKLLVISLIRRCDMMVIWWYGYVICTFSTVSSFKLYAVEEECICVSFLNLF